MSDLIRTVSTVDFLGLVCKYLFLTYCIFAHNFLQCKTNKYISSKLMYHVMFFCMYRKTVNLNWIWTCVKLKRCIRFAVQIRDAESGFAFCFVSIRTLVDLQEQKGCTCFHMGWKSQWSYFQCAVCAAVHLAKHNMPTMDRCWIDSESHMTKFIATNQN